MRCNTIWYKFIKWLGIESHCSCVKAYTHCLSPGLQDEELQTKVARRRDNLHSTKQETAELNHVIQRLRSDANRTQKQVWWSRWGRDSEEKHHFIAWPAASHQPSFGHIPGHWKQPGRKGHVALGGPHWVSLGGWVQSQGRDQRCGQKHLTVHRGEHGLEVWKKDWSKRNSWIGKCKGTHGRKGRP